MQLSSVWERGMAHSVHLSALPLGTKRAGQCLEALRAQVLAAVRELHDVGVVDYITDHC